MTRVGRRLALAGGVAGPAAFVTAWAVLGARAEGYSAVHDPISRLAAVGAPTRAAMTAGMLAFAGGVTAFAIAERRALGRRAAVAVGLTGIATAAVAALPLDASFGDEPHAVAAAVAYAALAAGPWLDASSTGRQRAVSRAVSGAIAAALLASALAPDRHGLLQRVGLTLGDLWIVAGASRALRHTAGSERGSVGRD
jgi:hypothetical protein